MRLRHVPKHAASRGIPGQNADETGLVVSVADNAVTFLSDMSMQDEVAACTTTCRKARHTRTKC
jgi:hypothetical protein